MIKMVREKRGIDPRNSGPKPVALTTTQQSLVIDMVHGQISRMEAGGGGEEGRARSCDGNWFWPATDIVAKCQMTVFQRLFWL